MNARRAGWALLAAAWLVSAPAWGSAALPLAGDRLYGLPPETAVRAALLQLPQLKIGALNQQLAASEQAKLVAGPGEWVLRAGLARRDVVENERYREQEVLLERSLRWFGKAGQDRAIGEQGVTLAAAQRADAWHEAARGLMQDWYDALRAQASVQLWQQQHALLSQLQGVAARRVRAGDAAALERMQADTELGRAAVQLEQASLQLRQALAQLSSNYPALPVPELGQLPEPPALPAGHAAQRAAITEDNHELELAEEESTWFRLKAERAASERMPDPTLTLRSTRERGGQERTLGLMLSFALPGGARSAEQGAAAVRAEMARERVSQVRTKVALAAEKVVGEQEAAFAVWGQLRQLADQQRRQADLMDKAYQAGECPISDVLQSRRLAQDAALVALAGRIQALAAQARVQLDAHALWSID